MYKKIIKKLKWKLDEREGRREEGLFSSLLSSLTGGQHINAAPTDSWSSWSSEESRSIMFNGSVENFHPQIGSELPLGVDSPEQSSFVQFVLMNAPPSSDVEHRPLTASVTS